MDQQTSIANPYTRRMAEFIANIRYEMIPHEVIARIKLLILDSLGCAIFGVDLPWSRILIDTLIGLDVTQTCAVWGTSRRLSAPHASLANGTLVQSFELDDVHRAGVLHVGAVTLPALLAIAELNPELSGRDFLAAAVAGYEIGPRVGLCMGPEHIGQGWHSGATVGVFSAAAGAAAGVHLSEGKVVHALGIAATQSSGLMAAQYGAMVKRMHAGRAAQSGLYAALLAKAGFTGIVDPFESEYGGFCTTFSRSTDRFDRTELTRDLGVRFETMNIALKFYSCVGSSHTALDAIRAIRARHAFRPDDVAGITVYGSRVTVDHVGWAYHPDGLTSAQLNLPYCVATLLLENDAFVDQFSEEMVSDPARLALAERVVVREDPTITARGRSFRHMTRVEITLRDGAHLVETCEAPRGSERNFATQAEVTEKFRKLTARRIPPEQSERILSRVMEVERLPSAATLLQAL